MAPLPSHTSQGRRFSLQGRWWHRSAIVGGALALASAFYKHVLTWACENTEEFIVRSK